MKLDIHDLRIGNYLYNDGVIVKIDARTIFDIWDDEGLKKYEPIPLTDDLLKKIPVFKKQKNGFYIFILDNEFSKITLFDFRYIELNNTSGTTWGSLNCYFLHDLQNMFRELTKTNLGITL